MRETLYFRLRGLDTPSSVAYCIAGDSAAVSFDVAHAPLETVLEQAAGRRVVGFIPGADVHLTCMELPARQRSKALLAAPFALEDQLADDVDALHFAIGSKQPSGWPLAAIRQSTLAAYVERLAQYGVRADALIPDLLALPVPGDEQMVLLVEAQDVLLRTSAYQGLSCLRDDLPLCLQLSDPDKQRTLRVIVPRNQTFDPSTLDATVEPLSGFSDPLEVLLQNYTPETAINLLQGDFAPGQDGIKWLKPWLPTAALLAGVGLMGAALYGVQAHQLKQQVRSQTAANQKRYQQIFPAETRIVDLDAQLGQQMTLLSNGTAQGMLLPLVGVTAEAMTGVPGLTLQAMQLREGALYVSLNASSLQAVEQLKKWFETPRAAQMEVQSANAGDRGVQIRIKLVAA